MQSVTAKNTVPGAVHSVWSNVVGVPPKSIFKKYYTLSSGYMCRTCRFLHRYTHAMVVSCIYHLSSTLGISPNAILPQSPTLCYPSLSPQLPNRPQCVMFPSLSPCVLSVQLPLMSKNMQCLVFYSCVSLLRVMVCSFILVSAKDMNSSFFMTV